MSEKARGRKVSVTIAEEDGRYRVTLECRFATWFDYTFGNIADAMKAAKGAIEDFAEPVLMVNECSDCDGNGCNNCTHATPET